MLAVRMIDQSACSCYCHMYWLYLFKLETLFVCSKLRYLLFTPSMTWCYVELCYSIWSFQINCYSPECIRQCSHSFPCKLSNPWAQLSDLDLHDDKKNVYRLLYSNIFAVCLFLWTINFQTWWKLARPYSVRRYSRVAFSRPHFPDNW